MWLVLGKEKEIPLSLWVLPARDMLNSLTAQAIEEFMGIMGVHSRPRASISDMNIKAVGRVRGGHMSV